MPASAKRMAIMAAAMPPPTTATSHAVSSSSQRYWAGAGVKEVHADAWTVFFIMDASSSLLFS